MATAADVEYNKTQTQSLRAGHAIGGFGSERRLPLFEQAPHFFAGDNQG